MVGAKPNRARDKPLTADSPAPRAQFSTRVLLGRLAREHVRPYIRRLLLAVACMILVAATTATYAWLMEPVLDEIFDKKNRTMLVVLPLAVIAVFFIKGAAGYGQAVLMKYVGQRIIADLQKRLFAHLMDADLAFYHSTATGSLIARFTNDVNMMRAAVSTALTGIVKELLTLVFLVGVMLYQQWSLALIACVIFPVAILPVVKIGKRMRKVSARTQTHVGHFTALLDETFQGARHVKAYGMEAYETGRAKGVVEELYKLVCKAMRTRALASPIMENLGGVAIAVVIFYGGWQVIDGATTTGAFFSFITALLLAYQPMKTLANLNAHLQEGLAAAQRVYTLLDTAPGITDRADAQPLAIEAGAITFENVRFAYGDTAPALDGVTLEVPAGRTAALVGPSGAGKSTLLHIAGLLETPDSGRVIVSGHDCSGMSDLERTRVRRGTMGFISHFPQLLPEFSALENVLMPQMILGRDRRKAEERAQELLASLGLAQRVNHRPAEMSGGEQQRTAIARALANNPRLILADEPTGNLDPHTAEHVFDSLISLIRGSGVAALIATHNFELARSMDRVLRLEDGVLVEVRPSSVK